MSTKEVAEAANKDIAVSGYEDYEGGGFENQTAEDYTVPFVQILQGLSPQVEDGDAKSGQILNTVTGEIIEGKDGIVFIPAITKHEFVEWVPRKQGGGFVGTHEPGSPMVEDCRTNQDFGKYVTPAGNDLLETFYVYGIAIDSSGNAEQAVIAFTSTKIKKYRNWMTKAKTIQLQLPGGRRIVAPLFAHKYRLTTVSEKNAEGSYYNWAIAFDGENAMEARLAPDDPMFLSAVAIKDLIDTGEAHAAYDKQNDTGGEEAAATGGKAKF